MSDLQDFEDFAKELEIRRQARELGMGNVVRFKDGTPIHGSLREAMSIWALMLFSMGIGLFLGLEIH